MRSSISRVLCASACLIGMALASGTAPTLAQDALPETLAQMVEGGANVELLASAEVGVEPDLGSALVLSRVTPPNDESLAVAVMGGPELWYVESGTLTLTGDGGLNLTLAAGESTLIPASGAVGFTFDGDDCPSALRLELTPLFAMRISSDEEAPRLGADGTTVCQPGGVLIEADQSNSTRPDPALATIARVTFPAESFVSIPGSSGPIGYVVESGELGVLGLPGANLGLRAGSFVSVAAMAAHSLTPRGGKESIALVAGAFGTGDGARVVPTPTAAAGVQGNDYLSPSYGYSLTWEPTWVVQAESSVAGSDYLHLSDGVSNVYFQADPFVGDVVSCLDGIYTAMPTREGFTNVRLGLSASGEEILSGDADRRFAIIQFDYTTAEATQAYTEYVECRSLGESGGMLVITHITLADEFPGQMNAFGALLDSLVIP